jgi:hypothetical protein
MAKAENHHYLPTSRQNDDRDNNKLSTITSPYKCPSLMHIVFYTLLVSVLPIDPSVTLPCWSSTDRHPMAGDASTQNCLMDAQMIYNKNNLCFHGNYVKGLRTLIIKYNISLRTHSLFGFPCYLLARMRKYNIPTRSLGFHSNYVNERALPARVVRFSR